MDALSIVSVVGCRPNFVKIAPLMDAMTSHRGIAPRLVHTGQHYDESLSSSFFRGLHIPEPDVHLGVGSGSPGHQTARLLEGLEDYLEAVPPDLVLVVGDVASTFAAALTATRLGIPVAHVEAGLRSFDREMPEEINRVLTDAIADYLFVTEPQAITNLRQEGIAAEKIFFTGNVLADTLRRSWPSIASSDVHSRLELEDGDYAMLTLHRPANVDDPRRLAHLAAIIEELGKRVPIVFPVHPRTAAQLGGLGLTASLDHVRRIPPLNYVDFIRLLRDCRFVMTDSGGVQEESTMLRVPCLTLRENTERPITVTLGTNELVGFDGGLILESARAILSGPPKLRRTPEKWDGHAAERIVSALYEHRTEIRELYRGVRSRQVRAREPGVRA
ncbi:MAG: UDP-N-acetylglucosamine 2-epimerase (non-hydrolyzing) [Candidatus Schekmanbacteria bacterium]|nr:UDP-N-acetylglucosamine 2-epimerase (non-hydrolyzing) [Candidatus Schekmanbacteria bacterium]